MNLNMFNILFLPCFNPTFKIKIISDFTLNLIIGILPHARSSWQPRG